MRNLKYAIACAIFTVLFIQTAIAQYNIYGKVTDSQNNPLPGANVIVKNTTLGAATNKEGKFVIKNLKNGNYTIRVSYFGYATLEIPVIIANSNTEINFHLQETSIDLNAVVVTGTRTEKSLKNTPVLTQSISIQELERKDAQNIIEALEMAVPGIEFASQAQGKSMTLQGIDPQYVIFLVNGERLAGDTYGDIDYSRINMADIERIEVVKGASSTLYGSNALGGVVNIITQKPLEKFGVKASTRFSKYNTQNYRFSTGSNLGKLSSQTSVVYDKTDGYDLLEGNSYRTQEKEDAVVVNQRLNYLLTHNLEIEAHGSFMNKNRDNTSASLYDRRNRDFSYGVKASWFLSNDNSLTLSWYTDNYELFNKVPVDSTSGNFDLQSDYNNHYNNARLLGNFTLADWNQLTVGAEYLRENLTAPRNNIDNKTNTDYIAFAQEDLQVSKAINVIAGARANHNSGYGWQVTPQLSAMYKIGHFTFRGSTSRGYKTPSLKEKYMSFQIPAPGPPMFLVGNENLQPEKSTYNSLSAEFSTNGFNLSVMAYQNKIKDMISENLDTFVVKPGGIIEYQYDNMNRVKVNGIDILMKARLANNLLFSATTTFTKKINDITDETYKNSRKFTGKYNLDYNYKVNNYRLNVNLQSNFYGKKSINLMDEVTHQTKELKLESFSLWRLTTTHRFNDNYSLKLGIDNIFDYTDPSGGYNTGTPGRTFFLGMGVNF